MVNKYLVAISNFLQAFRILEAQDQELQSPNVRIEPQETLIDLAVQELKKIDPNYFKNVRSIVSGTMSGYGEVRSGNEQDPNIIHINYQRIKNEVTNKIKLENPGASQEQINKAIVSAIVETLSHEKGHIKGYKPESGFTPESGAEQEATNIMQRFKA